MGERMVSREWLFYSFSLERHVAESHMPCSIDRFVDLSGIREHLRPFYSKMGRPSIDPELMIRMLIIGYCMGIRSERRLVVSSMASNSASTVAWRKSGVGDRVWLSGLPDGGQERGVTSGGSAGLVGELPR
jgi:hypothetical protein